ncbi:preprotein translocase SecA [Asanoa ishikariensis]|uniref:SEC-C motif-containing protein n=1 Tax=Asanoa ishikariensis TaxID=137265 RepID=A0A1H3UW75_9ACTN|nr:SEC-C domain-containing protein [Asanoa ishikariensis]GIF65219.1 preprotein translocase SecA [Asanoa ishikariensis]SDZ66674.1 SEC-C motif-containing protein [Asanoa ishikariensis]
MTIASLLSSDDLAQIAESATERGAPAAGAAELAAVVDEGRLADPADVPIALGMASDLLFEAEDMAGSLALIERAIAAHDEPGPSLDFARMFRAQLLFVLDRPDEAMAELTPLRPLLTQDPDAATAIAEALMAGDRGETAHEWLTAAVHEARASVPEQEPLDEAGALATEIVYRLVTERHNVRHELELPHDELDEMAEELEAAEEAEQRAELTAALSGPVLFFPGAEFERLAQILPEVASACGPTWDDHRADIERIFAFCAESGMTGETRLVRGTADELAAWLADRESDDPEDEVFDEYAEQIDEPGRVVPWPPARNDACWCGSGGKYKKCCLPRSRQD